MKPFARRPVSINAKTLLCRCCDTNSETVQTSSSSGGRVGVEDLLCYQFPLVFLFFDKQQGATVFRSVPLLTGIDWCGSSRVYFIRDGRHFGILSTHRHSLPAKALNRPTYLKIRFVRLNVIKGHVSSLASFFRNFLNGGSTQQWWPDRVNQTFNTIKSFHWNYTLTINILQ